MANMTTNTAELRKVASELTNYNGQFQQNVGRLIDDEAELSTMWEGEANKTFHNAFAKSVTSLDSFYKVIAEYIRVLQELARTYEEAEQRAADTAQNKSQG